MVENESVTLAAAVSGRQEQWNDPGSWIGEPGSRIGEPGSRIGDYGSISGLAVSFTSGGLETRIFFVASFIVVIR